MEDFWSAIQADSSEWIGMLVIYPRNYQRDGDDFDFTVLMQTKQLAEGSLSATRLGCTSPDELFVNVVIPARRNPKAKPSGVLVAVRGDIELIQHPGTEVAGIKITPDGTRDDCAHITFGFSVENLRRDQQLSLRTELAESFSALANSDKVLWSFSSACSWLKTATSSHPSQPRNAVA